MTDLLEPNLEAFQREAAAARSSLQVDPQRPQYHFTAPCNWLNDPNGLIQWRGGEYHLFYQHHPSGPLWANMHWGHAVSTDLVHWDDLPIALAPTPGSCDADGVFSGCAVDDHGLPTVIYTGVQGPRQLICIATGDDRLLRWRKDANNPVVVDFPSELNLLRTPDGTTHVRDPSVWREGDTWWMIVGSGISGVGGTVLLYRSPDLRHWEYCHPLLIGDINRRDPVWTGSMWECPQLFPLGDQHILLISVCDESRTYYPAYLIGTVADRRFVSEGGGVLDVGSLYAPQTFRDNQGRRILIGWLREQRSEEAMAASGWNGAMSLPWVLTLDGERQLRYTPAPEMEVLRRGHLSFANLPISPDEDMILPGVTGACLELGATIAPGDATAVGLLLRRAPDGVEETRVVYEPGSRRLFVDRTRSSLDTRADRTQHEVDLALPASEPLRLRIFLDRSILELVANERVILSERLYPTREDSLGVGLFATGGLASLETLDVWTMCAS